MCSQFEDRESKAEVEDLRVVHIAFGLQPPPRRRPAEPSRHERDVTGRSSEEPHRLQTTGARRETSRPDRKTPFLAELRPACRTVGNGRWRLDESAIVRRPRLQFL